MAVGYNAFVDAVRLSLLSELNRRRLAFERRTLHVQLELIVPRRARRDCANLVDAVCDGVQAAIGVDDLWFDGSWRTVIDPQMSRDPLLVVTVSQ